MENSLSLPNRSRVKWVLVGLAVLLLAGLIAFFVWQSNSGRIAIPQNVKSAAKSSIYMPSQLPGNYEIDETSFSVQEDTVVIFSAKDGAGSRIIFTEQPKPANFDFDAFYKTQMQEQAVLAGVPFTSVTGKANDKQTTMLSIVTPETWVIVSSASPLTSDDTQLIAKHLVKY